MRATRTFPRKRRVTSLKKGSWMHTLFHAGAMALLLMSIFGNLYAVQPVAAQQQDNTPPPFPNPSVVVVAGSFQTALGCGTDWDKECNLTNLNVNGDGTWTNTFPIPTGSYTYRVVTRSDIDRSFGEDGDPDGDDIQLDVPDGALGVFFSFNQWTGAIYHAVVFNTVELATDLGQFPMSPTDEDGEFFAVISTDPGIAFGAQVLVDGNPVSDIASIDSGNEGRVVVTADLNGGIDSNAVDPAALTVFKSDADGNPLPGACFSVYDGDEVAGQACDSSDGEDGATRIEFPVGAGGRLTLAESRTPDGQETSEPQDIDLDAGENQIGVVAGGGGGQTRDIPLVNVQFVMTDDAGNAIPGGCLVLDGVGELCDDDGDAVITFEGVASNASYNVSETVAPDGYQQFGSTSIDVGDSDVQFQIPHSPADVTPETGSLQIFSTDDQGNPLTGSCFTVEPDGDTQGDTQTVCDADDGEDGVTTFPQLNAGTWDVSQETTPDGYESAESIETTIYPNETTQENMVSPSSGPGIGNLILFTVDQDGNPVPGVCYEVSDQGQQCDEDGDGDMGLVEIPAGEYTVQQVSVPDGYDLDENPQTITVEEGSETTLTFTSPTSEADTQAVRIDVVDQDGNPVSGVCFTVTDLNGNEISSVCDDDADGDARFDLEDGDYNLVTIQVPDGYEGAEGQPFSVQGDSVDLTVTVNSTATEEPTEEPSGGNGTLNIAVTDTDGFAIIGACVQIDGPVSGEVCDNGNGDANPEDGFITINDLPAGEYEVSVTQLPDGYDPAPPINVTIEDGGSTDGFLTSGGGLPDEPTATPEPETGNLLIRKYDENRNDLAGACFSLTDASGNVIEVCDGGDGDEDERDGRVRINGLAPGDYTLTETVAPDGYTPADPQTVTIVAGETTRVNIDNVLGQGSVLIRTGDGSQLLGGACYELSGFGEACDDDADGVVAFDGIAPGDYTVTQTRVPDGYLPTEPVDQAVSVVAGGTAELDFVIATALGTIRIAIVDVNGNTIDGSCVTLNGGDEICDNSGSDGDATVGVILLAGLEPGDVEIFMSTTPAGYADGGSTTVTVVAGQQTDATFTLSVAPGRIDIVVQDSSGERIGGSCFAINGGEPFCDNGDSDGNDDDGVIRVSNLDPGDYTLTMTQAPDGYQLAPDQAFTVTAGERTRVDVVIDLSFGAIQVSIVDANTVEPVPGACISSDALSDEVCDNGAGDSDPTDALILVENVPPGVFVLSISTAPDGYAPVEGTDETVTVASGETAQVERRVALIAGNLNIFVRDGDGNAVGGSCLSITGSNGTAIDLCDDDSSDNDPAPGNVSLLDLVPGDYTVIVVSAPEGYAIPEIATTATVIANETAEALVTLVVIPPTETATEEATETEEPTATEVVIEEPTETEVIVVPPVDETATEEPEPETGSIRILLTDGDGNALVGGCFDLIGDAGSAAVCDNDASDSDSADGAVQVDEMPVGAYLVSQTLAPDGYSAAADQNTAIDGAGEIAEVTFVNETTPLATGSLLISAVDGDGNPVGGACFQVSTIEVCDNQSGDEDNRPGYVLISGLTVGDYTVTETQAPEGFQIAADQNASIEADATAEVTFAHEAAEAETGGVILEMTDIDGNPAPDSCIVLTSAGPDGPTTQEFCDNGPEDQNPEPAMLELQDLPTGTYKVQQAPDTVPQSDDQAFGPAALDSNTFTVQANITIQIVVIIIIELPEVGDLQITKRAADTNLLQTGACFRVTGEGNEIEVCDNDDVDLNGANGIIRLEDLTAGDYLIEEITAPPGYEIAPSKNTTIPNGATRSILFKDEPVADTTGGLIVLKIDGEGNLLPGACFQLRDEGNPVVTVCDDEDGSNDGRITFTDVTAGDYLLRETVAPSAEWQKAPDTVVNIYGGVDDQEIEIVNELKPGRIRVLKVDEADNPLGGACFGLDRGSGIEFEACDNGAGDASATLGTIQFNNIPAGEWELLETLAPDGYDPAADQTINLNPGTTEIVTVENTPSVPSPDNGSVVINKLVDGDLAPGACFSLKQGVVTKYAACDGNNDGVIEFATVAVGNYTVVETKAPNPTSWFIIAAPFDITVEKDETTEVDVDNELKPGRILVVKKNTNGQLLQGACFKIAPDPNSAGQKCTNATGQVSFDNLPTDQTYKLTETIAPNGYQKANPISGITLTPGLTTTVNVVDKKTPPPPTDGSILVIKFFCPTTDTTVVTKWLDSSDPGPDKLVETSGCDKGDARFSLVPSGGGTGFEFNTGQDGEFFTTLAKGNWSLKEISPQESDPTTVVIYAGAQTTVVVIDYVEPPAPEPATINLLKYTCAPGFGGVYYVDFLNNCTDDSQLTNGVSFRTSGPTVANRITGASGQVGRATFTGLKAGDYTLYEEGVSSSASVYMFCGYDVYNWADWYSTTASIWLPLKEGAKITCIVFNVPDDLSDSTGAIVVHKYVCNGTNFPAGYDYFANCPVETDGVKFGISVKQGNSFVPKTTAITNQNGLISFGRLKPGTYQLKEIGSDWCYAKSDNVDAQGNLIVRAGERTNVWIFNCEPTKQPPNTGTGAAAGVIGGGSAVSGAGAALTGFAWPVIGLVGFRARKRFGKGRRLAA